MATSKTVLGNIVNAVVNNISKIKEAIGTASSSTSGLMSSTDKSKLDGVASNANKTTIVNNLTATTAGSALDATQGKALNDKIESFQTGVDTLYNMGVSLGVIPSAKTPNAIYGAVYGGFDSLVYQKCVSLGVTPSAITYAAVADALSSIGGNSDTDHVFIVYPSSAVGVMGDPTADYSSNYNGYNAFKVEITVSKLDNIADDAAGVWHFTYTIKFGRKGYNQVSSASWVTYFDSAPGNNPMYYPSESSPTDVIIYQKDSGQLNLPAAVANMPDYFWFSGSLTLLKFNNNKTRIYILQNVFNFTINGDSSTYYAPATAEYSVTQAL